MHEVTIIEVDIIIPVHNASSSVKDAVLSALHQEIPSSPRYAPSPLLQLFLKKYSIFSTVCCYDDGSDDNSLIILRQIESSELKKNGVVEREATSGKTKTKPTQGLIPSRLLVESSKDGKARGAGYARNRAIEMNNKSLQSTRSFVAEKAKTNENCKCFETRRSLKFLCLLDSDDIMHKHRIIEQVLYMMYIVDDKKKERTILGSTFKRDPPDSTWHYSNWANNLSDERLMLERYREITILQPTWFMPLQVWSSIGGYIEAPSIGIGNTVLSSFRSSGSSLKRSHMVHPKFDTACSLQLAEDLRFFHSHLESNGNLCLHRTALATTGGRPKPLVTYRHTDNDQSQSFRTSRKLLLQLRVLAFQRSVIRVSPYWNSAEKLFVIWGCGRDGKDFFKALDQDLQERVYCFVDVDPKKLNAGYYMETTSYHDVIEKTKHVDSASKNRKKKKRSARKIPILHFSYLVSDQQEQEIIRSRWIDSCMAGHNFISGCIDKSKSGSHYCSPTVSRPKKKHKFGPTCSPIAGLNDRGLNRLLLSQLPVVVCVAMYRTNGILESNVEMIGRVAGENLWHFS